MWRDSYATKKYMAHGRIFFWEEFAWMLSFFVRWHYMYGRFPVPSSCRVHGAYCTQNTPGCIYRKSVSDVAFSCQVRSLDDLWCIYCQPLMMSQIHSSTIEQARFSEEPGVGLPFT